MTKTVSPGDGRRYLCTASDPHKAGLNYGDCFVYALAKVRGEKLLCKGKDFPETDLVMFPMAVD